jgi:dolichol-phosphate mannosyltransferase
MKPTLSIIVPALNEEPNIAGTVEEITAAVGDHLGDYEVLLINDGSTDRTGPIMDQLAAADPHVRVAHNPVNLGLGAAYKVGLSLARFDHVMLVPGDNCFARSSLALIFARVGDADITATYPVNPQVRDFFRRCVSSSFTYLISLVFGLGMRYYNGATVHRTRLVRRITITADSFAFQAEILIKLLRRGAGYVQVGVPIIERRAGQSAALKPRNVARVLLGLVSIFVEVNTRPARSL